MPPSVFECANAGNICSPLSSDDIFSRTGPARTLRSPVLVMHKNGNNSSVSFGAHSTEAHFKDASTIKVVMMHSAPDFKSKGIQRLHRSTSNLKDSI
ncbi:MAG: hypothetical protein J3R72DRAFT_484558 [Linnemannia gamsii]|nr:MAG: hypothetical protein J3R72DRAFT_484558 [Linnemannia gamsii]